LKPLLPGLVIAALAQLYRVQQQFVGFADFALDAERVFLAS